MTFVLRLVDDRGRAEDVVQETMLRGWRNLDRIDPSRGDPRAYLFAVARNLVIDLWRADERRPRLVGDDDTWPRSPSAIAPTRSSTPTSSSKHWTGSRPNTAPWSTSSTTAARRSRRPQRPSGYDRAP